MTRFSRKLVVENLADRIVPASYANLDAGTLFVGGSGDIKVVQTGNKITVDGLQIFHVAQGKNVKSVNASEVSRIEADGDSGPNLIDLKSVKSAGARIFGRGGDDTIYGTDRSDVVVAGSGDDLVRGGNGNDEIYGEAGKDKLYGDKGGDVINGNDDDDLIDGGDCGVFASTGGHFVYFYNYLYGNDGNDVILGGPCRDFMYGHEGDDEMDGAGDDDYMEGNAGLDVMSGGDGNDVMFGHEDADEMSGDGGNDNMEGEEGDDRMFGGDGRDEMDAGDGNDSADGDAGNDTIELGIGNDTGNGGAGNDKVEGGAGDDSLRGGAGNDAIDGAGGADQALGEAGNDTLDMGDGPDRADGGAGHDLLEGGEGIDVLAGLEGNDVLDGGIGPDDLFGGPGNDKLEGGDGDDRLTGEDGKDLLIGGPGRDHLDGGKNRDIFHGDEEGENLFDTTSFDTYADAFNLAKPVFGTAAVGDIVRNDPHTEATLVGLGATVQSLGSKEFVKLLQVVDGGGYDVTLDGEATPRRVAFDGAWSDNDPVPSAEQRLLPARSAAEKLEFWTILFARARMAKYSVDPATFKTDAQWTAAHTVSGNRLLDEEAAFEDYSSAEPHATPVLSALPFADLQALLKEHAGVIAEAAAGTGLTTDKVERGSGYVVTAAFTAGGKQWVRLYNVAGYDTEPGGALVDNIGVKKNDGFITLEYARFTDPANFADLHAWK